MLFRSYLEKRDGKATLIPEREFRDSFPKIYAYLLQHKDALVGRQDSRKSYATGHSWYRHLRAGRFSYIRPEKITVKGIARRLSTGVLRKNTAFDGANCPSILFRDRAGHDLNYFLGLLNSRLLSFHLRTVCPPKLSGYTRFSASCIALVPIRVIDRDSAKELKSHDRIVTLVERMLTLHAQLAKAKAPPVRTGTQSQIESTDREIDRIVYELYGLTEAEIRIVEGASGIAIEPDE